MDEKRKRAAPLLVAALIVGSFVAYLAGYFWLGEYEADVAPSGTTAVITRGYRSRWAYHAYRPAAWIESKLRGIPVGAWWTNDPDPFD